MTQHEPTSLTAKSVQQVSNHFRAAVSKNDARYWRDRIFHTTNDRGQRSRHYGMKVQIRGRRFNFALGSANKEGAARTAAQIYNELITLGIEATLAKRRPQPPPVKVVAITSIGDWISAASKVFDGKPATFGGYARALRFIASEILAVSKNKKRYGRTQAKDYRRYIDAAPLTILTPEAIQAWRIRYVKRETPAQQRSARTSCNSALRQARALFSRQILGFIAADLVPSPLPFIDAKFYPRESMKYQSRLDPVALLQSARKDLFESAPEAFKALLLALGAGLRRGEVDRLLWRQVDFAAGVIRIEATEASGLKTEDSAGSVPIDVGLVSLLRGFKAKARGQYVIEGGSGVALSKPWAARTSR